MAIFSTKEKLRNQPLLFFQKNGGLWSKRKRQWRLLLIDIPHAPAVALAPHKQLNLKTETNILQGKGMFWNYM